MDLRGEDLFTVAGSLAELIGAPITIEDENSTVLAYSSGEQAVDEARIGTILGRQVPGRYRQLLTEAGVFERLHHDTDVIYVDLHVPDMRPRAAIAVRDGGRPVGSIWAAVTAFPTPEQEAILRSAVPVVAEHIAAQRERVDVTRRLQVDRVRALLTGGEPAFRAADDLRWSGPMTVAAAAPVTLGSSLPSGLLASLGLYLDTLAVESVAAQLDDTIYVVIAAGEKEVRRLSENFLGRARSGHAFVVAVGRGVDTAGEAHLSRGDADRILAALQHASRGGVVGTMRDTLASVLALRVADIFDGLGTLTPLAALLAHDEQHGTDLVATARAFLDHGGDVADAAAALHIHPNTLRNRLRRCVESCGVDLSDADTRLVLMLHLKLRGLREH
ncbi:helix-turn-helix domain-containing protein [Rhodococcus sp. USK13]|uniref:PucR family transcriptional regulator n=1 Tax=Rhodococcus sp. USK13 TaxID=2806442 RepID=UPI001BCEF4FB|nr:helix-turn-helix domain-containing protein [Rhodococcus sp. USK13]